MNDIDVHIIVPPKWKNDGERKWFDQCIESLETEPVNIHLVDRVQDDTRRARFTGYQQGSAPYVSFVDPDDYVMPGAFSSAMDAWAAKPDAVGVYTNYWIRREDRIIQRHLHNQWSRKRMVDDLRLIHQLVITPRDTTLAVYENHFDDIPPVWFELCSFAVFLAQSGDWINDPNRAYVWRKHDMCDHLTRQVTAGAVLEWQQWACQQFNLPIPMFSQTSRWGSELIQPGYRL